MATQAPLHPALADDSDGDRLAPTGRLGRRGLVYTLLCADRAAHGPGLSLRDFAEAGISTAAAHLESLRFEGHGFEQLQGRDERGNRIDRVRLITDAWEET